MMKCKECGNEISDKADSCPKCGAKVKRTSFLTKIVAGMIGIGVVMSIYGSISAGNQRERAAAAEQNRINALTPEQRAKEIASQQAAQTAKSKEDQLKELRFQKTLLVAKSIKQAMRNPDSFSLDDAFANDDGSVICINYRGQNGFGGINKESATYANGKLTQDAGTWNKNCAHKSLFDIGYVRQAL